MKLYRYQRNPYSQDWNRQIELVTFEVIKETPKGFWIQDIVWRKRFVLKSQGGRVRFAYETKKQALYSFKYRTKKCVEICQSNLNKANNYLKQVELMIKNETYE